MKNISLFILILFVVKVSAQGKRHIDSFSLNYMATGGFHSENLNNVSQYKNSGEEFVYLFFDETVLDFGAVSLKLNFAEFKNNSFFSLEFYQLERDNLMLGSSTENYQNERLRNFTIYNDSQISYWKTQVGINYNFKVYGGNKRSGIFIQFSDYLCYRYIDYSTVLSIDQPGFSTLSSRVSIGPFARVQLSKHLFLDTSMLFNLLDFGFKNTNYTDGASDFGTFVDFYPSYTLLAGLTYYFEVQRK